jgi:hypothetical protein
MPCWQVASIMPSVLHLRMIKPMAGSLAKGDDFAHFE